MFMLANKALKRHAYCTIIYDPALAYTFVDPIIESDAGVSTPILANWTLRGLMFDASFKDPLIEFIFLC